MDHVAGCAPDQVADLRPGGGAGIGGLGKRAGLHGHSYAGSSTAYAVTVGNNGNCFAALSSVSGQNAAQRL
jgi:hypothetical protein